MTHFAVIQTIGGFAREDARQANLVGVYSNETVANQVKALSGFDAQVVPVEIDLVPPGYIRSAEQMGFKIGESPRKR